MNPGRGEAAVFLNTKYDAVLLTGGFDINTKTYVKTIQKYGTEANKWSDIGTTPYARYELATMLLGDDLYIAGGVRSLEQGDRQAAERSVESFNIHTGGKTSFGPKLIKAREVCKAAALDENVLCVLGGHDDDYVYYTSVEVFDKREGKWPAGIIVTGMPKGISDFGFAYF